MIPGKTGRSGPSGGLEVQGELMNASIPADGGPFPHG
jgi:hypothetical protein